MNKYLDHYSWHVREVERALGHLRPQLREFDSISRTIREQTESLSTFRDRYALPNDYLTELSRIRETLEACGNISQLKILTESQNKALQEIVERQNELEALSSRVATCSDLSFPSQRVLETLSSTEALLGTARLKEELIAAAVQPQIAYQKFARIQLELAAYSSEIVRANRLIIVDAAADLLEEMGRGFEFASLLHPTGLDVEEESEPEPEWPINVFTELSSELEGVNLEEPERTPEDLVLESKSAQIAYQGGRIVQLVYNLNTEAERDGKPVIFKPTTKALFGCSIIPTRIATEENNFSEIVDFLYFLLYEGSGSASRLTERRSADQLEALWTLKHLRLGSRHDIDHGADKEIEKKNRQVGEAYKSLIGKVAPRSKADWIQAQISLYDQLAKMLETVWFEDEESAGDS